MSLPALYVPQHAGDAADPATSRRVIEYLRAAAEVAGARVVAESDNQIVLEPKRAGGLFGGFRSITIRLRPDRDALVCEVTTGGRSLITWLQLLTPIGFLGTLLAAPGRSVALRLAGGLGILAFTAFTLWQTVQLPRRMLSEWLSTAVEKAAAQSAGTLPADPVRRSDLARLAARADGTRLRRRVRLFLTDGSMIEGKLANASPTQVTLALTRQTSRDIPLSAIATIEGAVARSTPLRVMVYGYAGTLIFIGFPLLYGSISNPAISASAVLKTFLLGAAGLGAGTAIFWRKFLTKWERWLTGS